MARGKYGLKPAIPGRPAASFVTIRRAGGPPLAVPPAQDNLKAIAALLKMLGNDKYGDCVAVAVANLILLITGVYPDEDAVLEFYTSQNKGFPSVDGGMVIQLALEYLVKVGVRLPDGTYKKALFFAKVDHTNPGEVAEALALFGGGIYGITVTQRNEDEFDAGRTWTWVTGDADQGGHGVLGAGYVTTPLGRDFGTWAQETFWDKTFDGHQVGELWVVLFAEHLAGREFLSGVSMSQVASEWTRLTDTPFPETPAPNPVPVVPPAPVGADAVLATAAHVYLKHHGSTAIGRALAQWLAATGQSTP